MDARFGDPSISAPTQGSWNEMPPLRKPVKTDPFGAQTDINNHKVGRLKSLMRAQTVSGSPDYSVGTTTTTTTTTAARVDNFPRHPMVDMHNHQRSVSVDRIQGRLEKQRNSSSSSSQRLSSSRHQHRTSYDSCSGSDADDDRDPETGSVNRQDMVRHYTSNRSRSQEDHSRAQHKTSPPLPTPHRQHKSPPLSSTAMMRRYSSQSESTRTFVSTSTPSTASFSSKHTSMTTPGLHGFSGSAVPPLLKEEEGHGMMFGDEYVPPVPSLRDNKAAVSASSSPPSASSRGHSRNGRSKQKQYMVPVGPQELVPSNDELWGY